MSSAGVEFHVRPSPAIDEAFDARGLPISRSAFTETKASALNPVAAASVPVPVFAGSVSVPIANGNGNAAAGIESVLAIDNAAAHLSFGWENVSVVIDAPATPNDKRVLLNAVSGTVAPGELLGIMGPSGSGKTTLLDILSGRLTASSDPTLKLSGECYINGTAIGGSSADIMKHVTRYVPQEDNLLGTMTVRETLQFSANLQLPASMSDADKTARVNGVIEELGLATCADTRIGTVFQKGISGGQKRRVSIGIELLTLPRILFLDEPTSGLDSAAAQSVVDLLSRLAKGGRVVICTIHQPSSSVFARLDKLYLLSAGLPVYFGPTRDLVPYLASNGVAVPQYANPADHALQVINTDFGATPADIDRLNRAFVASRYNQLIAAQLTAEKSKQFAFPVSTNEFENGVWTQFWEIARRTMTDNIRNPGVYWIRLIMYVMLSFMIGGVFYNIGNGQSEVTDRAGLLFYVAAFMVFMSIAVVPTFIAERSVFLRERNNGWYSEGPYVLAGAICGVPGVFIIALTASVIVCLLSGISDSGDRFGYFLLNLFLSLLVAESLMTLISAIAPIYIIGMALGAGVFGMFMITEGFLQVRSNIPDWFIWSYYIGFHTYTFEMFMYNEFHDRPIDCDEVVAVVAGVDKCRFADGNAVLDFYDMGDTRMWLDIVVLLINMVAFRLFFYCILKYVHRNKK